MSYNNVLAAVCIPALPKSSEDLATPIDISSRCLEFVSLSPSSMAAALIHRLISKISP